MKQLVISVLAVSLALLVAPAVQAQTSDRDGHRLVSEWKEYDDVCKKDKPKDELRILATIKEKALALGYAFDYFDAGSRYVEVRGRINWKDWEAAEASWVSELQEHGAPIAVSLGMRSWSMQRRRDYIREHEPELRNSHNKSFYPKYLRGYHDYSKALVALLSNDYEFLLWYLFYEDERQCSDIVSYYGGAYPCAALVEYHTTEDKSAFAEKYKGRAVSLLARGDILADRFTKLLRADCSDQKEFISLRDDCAALAAEVRHLRGDEAKLLPKCSACDNVLDQLSEKSIDVSADDREVIIGLRNLSSVRLEIKSGKSVLFAKRLVNGKGSLYVKDTIRVPVPVLDDGEYDFVCTSGSVRGSCLFSKSTLSIAVKKDADGFATYVADYKTGEPVGQCSIDLCRNRKAVATADLNIIDGYVRLPSSMQQKIRPDDGSYTLRARAVTVTGRKRTSFDSFVSPSFPSVVNVKDESRPSCILLTDKGAYRPGETVKFKAILYKGIRRYDLLPEGSEVSLRFIDAENREIAAHDLTTNEFGSVAGEFLVPSGLKGGTFCINVLFKRSVCGSTGVTVDEFILPSFDLSWDEDKTLVFPGDEFIVSGRLMNYSGHPMVPEQAVYEFSSAVSSGSGTLELDENGCFSIAMKAVKAFDSFNVKVEVTDRTGQTREFSCWRSVQSRLRLDLKHVDPANAKVNFSGMDRYRSASVVDGQYADFRCTAGPYPSLKMEYSLRRGEKMLASGILPELPDLHLDLSKYPSAMFELEVKASAVSQDGTLYSDSKIINLAKVDLDDCVLPFDAKAFFREVPCQDGVAVQVGSSDGPVWAVAESFVEGNRLVDARMLRLTGEGGTPGSLGLVEFKAPESGHGDLSVKVQFFKDSALYDYSCSRNFPDTRNDLPLSFVHLADKAAPSSWCTVQIHTEPGVECAASVFDLSSEQIKPNRWRMVEPARLEPEKVYYSDFPGGSGVSARGYDMEYCMVGSSKPVLFKSVAANAAMVDHRAVSEDEMDSPAPSAIRSDFATSLAWEPFLHSDADGDVEFRFKTSDRLSTYVVQLFAHDANMRNSVLRREMLVTVPVKVDMIPPQILYQGDCYSARVSLSNAGIQPIDGSVELAFYDGTERDASKLLSRSRRLITIPARGSVPFNSPLDIPQIDTLGIFVQFSPASAGAASDAMFVTVPVRPACQSLTEAHSSVLRPGDDRSALIDELRSRFVNVPGENVTIREISIRQMLAETLPTVVKPSCDNVLAQADAFLSATILKALGHDACGDAVMQEIILKIRSCRKSDGGYAWFETMSSSPAITAALLLHRAQAPGLMTDEETESAVRYLDASFFEHERRLPWCGMLSLEQYLHVRAMYASVPFSPSGVKSADMREFKKSVREYLTPRTERGLSGDVYAKARRLSTLRALEQSADGMALAGSWGLNVFVSQRLSSSLRADLESLLQYAVPHRCGGVYFPNLVMPFRGLLESELSAHVMMCGLLDQSGHFDMAEGIRYWMMLQKETQQWGDDPSFVSALACVFHGSEHTLDTRVVALSADFVKPFREIQASGNGFTVERHYFIGNREIRSGDHVAVGERIRAEYRIWNEENRSFVRLCAPRPASMQPVDQLSGRYGWMARPLRAGGWFSFSPQGYRSVHADRTEYWFDSYPEDKTTVTEEFYVTQEGEFVCPAVEVESLYAPHYRANDKIHYIC